MYDLVVLGGGPAALHLATAAARVGAKVAVIDNGRRAGGSAYGTALRGQALSRTARLVREIRAASPFGIEVQAPEVDFAAVMARVRSVSARSAAEESAESLRDQRVELILGSPSFVAYDTVLVDGHHQRVNAHRFVIATGASPAIPAIPGLADAGYLDSASIWDLNELPASLLIVGSEATGLELGQAFARLGSKVTILTETPRILPAEDRDVSALLQSTLAEEGIAFHTDVTITGITIQDGWKVVKFRGNARGDTFEARRTHVLVATGRQPNVKGLNLEMVGIHIEPGRGIDVDDYLQTSSRNVLAIGDVVAGSRVAQAEPREADIAFQNAVLRLAKKMNYRSVPSTTFTDPEVSSVGLSETEAREGDAGVRVLRVGYDELVRARIDGRTTGFAKVFVSPGGKILGATIIGEGAGTVIQELVLAMEHGLTLHDHVLNTPRSFPTYGALVHQLAMKLGAARMEKGLVQTALRWFYGYEPRSMAENPAAMGSA